MKNRANHGQTLSLVAVFALLIVILGVLCFFLARLVGGSREFDNATDAGILKATRDSIGAVPPPPAALPPNPYTVSFGITPGASGVAKIAAPQDFFYCDSRGTESVNKQGTSYDYTYNYTVTPGTFNRLVAQAAIVAQNAQGLYTASSENLAAVTHAQEDVASVNQIGKKLNTLANGGGNNLGGNLFALNNDALGMANANSLKMTGNQQITLLGNLNTAYLDAGHDSNVWFDPNVFGSIGLNVPINKGTAFKPDPGTTDPNGLGNVYGTGNLASGGEFSYATNSQFMAGYEPITVLSLCPGGPSTLYMVPNLPGTNPHLVTHNAFKNPPAPPAPTLAPGAAPAGVPFTPAVGTVPPNAFSATCVTTDKRTGYKLSTISSAIQGCGKIGVPNSGTQYYYASIPAGYIRIINAPVESIANTNSGPTITNVAPGDFNQVVPGDPATNQTWDGANDIFNTYLNSDAGDFISAYGSGSPSKAVWVPIGTDNPKGVSPYYATVLDEWIKYLQSSGTDALGHDAADDPLSIASGGKETVPDEVKTHPNLSLLPIRIGGKDATIKELVDSVDGSYTAAKLQDISFDSTEKAWATQLLPLIEDNVGAAKKLEPIIAGFAGKDTGMTGAEWLKTKFLDKRAQAYNDGNAKEIILQLPDGLPAGTKSGTKSLKSGMHQFQHFQSTGASSKNSQVHYAAFQLGSVTYGTTEFGTVGTPTSLLAQVYNANNKANMSFSQAYASDSNLQTLINKIAQRTMEINPSFNAAAVVNALNSTSLPVASGQNVLYLHANASGQLVLDSNVPYDNPSLAPDGSSPVTQYQYPTDPTPIDIGLSQ